MAIKLELESAKTMKSIVEAMVPVSVEVAIEISEQGFRAQAKSAGNTWAVDTFLKKEAFDTYESSETVIFNVDLKDFSDFLKTAKSDDKLEIKDDKERATLDLKLSSEKIVKEMSLRLNEHEDDKFMRIIDKPFDSNCTMITEIFADAVRAAELGDEHVTLTHTADQLHFEAKTPNRSANATILYNNDYVENVDFKTPGPFVSTFALRYLKHISKVGGASEPLKLSMANNQPLRIVFSIGSDDGHIAFAVAPRVMDDYGT